MSSAEAAKVITPISTRVAARAREKNGTLIKILQVAAVVALIIVFIVVRR